MEATGEALMLLIELIENTELPQWHLREILVGLLAIHKEELIKGEIVCLGCGGVFVAPCPTIQYMRKAFTQWDSYSS